MSEHNYMGLAFSENLKKNPDFFNLDNVQKQIAETIKAQQAVDAKNAVARADSPRTQYNKLAVQLSDLKQNCKCFEIRVNEAAGQVHLLESRITEELTEKKKCVSDGNLRGERFYEHRVELLEDELADAKMRLQGARSNNTAAIRALKAFDGYELLAQLKAQLDIK